MIYSDRQFKLKTAILLPLFFLAAGFIPWIFGIGEFSSGDGLLAIYADELCGFPPFVTVHGELPEYGGYPLLPLIIRGFTELGCSAETALRILPLLFMFILFAVVFLAAYSTVGGKAAAPAAAAALIGNIFIIDKYAAIPQELLGAVLILLAWLAWFNIGVWRGKWELAWVVLAFFAALAFYAVGFIGLLLVAAPMLFLRRPMGIWNRMNGAGFLLGLLFIFFVILFWSAPRWQQSGNLHFNAVQLLSSGTALVYFKRLALFPFDVIFRFMPVSFFLWAPFCPAITPLDQNPLFSKYLKTLSLTSFAIIWLSPFTDAEAMIYLLGPAAVLAGLNYWIVIIRIGNFLRHLVKWCGVAALVTNAAAMFYFAMPKMFEDIFKVSKSNIITDARIIAFGFCAAAAGIVLAAAAIHLSRKEQGGILWAAILCSVFANAMPYQSIMLPCKTLARHKKNLGMQLAEPLKKSPDSDIVYKTGDVPLLYAEGYYSGKKIRSIQSVKELPKEAENVYVLSLVVPSVPERKWDLLARIQYRKIKLELWRGRLITEE